MLSLCCVCTWGIQAYGGVQSTILNFNHLVFVHHLEFPPSCFFYFKYFIHFSKYFTFDFCILLAKAVAKLVIMLIGSNNSRPHICMDLDTANHKNFLLTNCNLTFLHYTNSYYYIDTCTLSAILPHPCSSHMSCQSFS